MFPKKCVKSLVCAADLYKTNFIAVHHHIIMCDLMFIRKYICTQPSTCMSFKILFKGPSNL